MSHPNHRKRAGRAGIVLSLGLAFAALPAAAQASAIGLGTAGPFAVLGGATVTNTGPSVLNGDLGVSPGTALVGFGSPAVVNGATHANDAVARQAQLDLNTAYDAAATQPVAPDHDLTGTDLGNRTLTPGAYGYTSSAQLTGPLTLDAQGDPNAQFVFKIGSALTTASASSVVLINGASPCNVFWQVASSATLGSTTAFQGNLMTLSDISVGDAATVTGRLLARSGGQVSLINDVIDGGSCTRPPAASSPDSSSSGAATSGSPTSSTAPDSAPASAGAGASPPASRSTLPTRKGTATLVRRPRTPHSGVETCTQGFRAAVRGRLIKQVVFSLDGRRVASRSASPFEVLVRAAPGNHRMRARVTFRDATRARTLSLAYRACSSAVLRPRPGRGHFTG